VSEQVAKRLVTFAMIGYAASMAMPVRLDGSRTLLGFQFAVLAVVGAFSASPVCIVGCLGNLLFCLASVLAIIRLARGRPRPSFALIWKLGAIAAAAMIASWAWLRLFTWLDIGSWTWVASGAAMAVGSWRLRFEAGEQQVRGFEVIPVAALAPVDQRNPQTDQRLTS
jgi:hypothetical protein